MCMGFWSNESVSSVGGATGTYLKDLRNLENVSLVTDGQWVSDNLRATQEQEWKEIEEWIAECTRHIDDFRVSY